MTARRGRYQPLDRIWARGVRDPATGCLLLPGDDYGMVSVRGTLDRVHRLAWRLSRHRPIPPGRMVTHRCDRKPCFEPTHLRLGTAASNAAEAVARGRIRRGERHPGARLTEADVVAIRAKRRADGSLHRELADEYGVARTTISSVVRGATWAWVDRQAAA
jgi:hypothetical protein